MHQSKSSRTAKGINQNKVHKILLNLLILKLNYFYIFKIFLYPNYTVFQKTNIGRILLKLKPDLSLFTMI